MPLPSCSCTYSQIERLATSSMNGTSDFFSPFPLLSSLSYHTCLPPHRPALLVKGMSSLVARVMYEGGIVRVLAQDGPEQDAPLQMANRLSGGRLRFPPRGGTRSAGVRHVPAGVLPCGTTLSVSVSKFCPLLLVLLFYFLSLFHVAIFSRRSSFFF